MELDVAFRNGHCVAQASSVSMLTSMESLASVPQLLSAMLHCDGLEVAVPFAEIENKGMFSIGCQCWSERTRRANQLRF